LHRIECVPPGLLSYASGRSSGWGGGDQGLLAELARRGQADMMLAAGKTTTIDLA
jgi:hypothetical protein